MIELGAVWKDIALIHVIEKSLHTMEGYETLGWYDDQLRWRRAMALTIILTVRAGS